MDAKNTTTKAHFDGSLSRLNRAVRRVFVDSVIHLCEGSQLATAGANAGLSTCSRFSNVPGA